MDEVESIHTYMYVRTFACMICMYGTLVIKLYVDVHHCSAHHQ